MSDLQTELAAARAAVDELGARYAAQWKAFKERLEPCPPLREPDDPEYESWKAHTVALEAELGLDTLLEERDAAVEDVNRIQAAIRGWR